MNKKDNKKGLITRVEKAQMYLKHKGIKDAKVRFFDNYYGVMFKAESDRLTNLWARKITDVEFTNQLEEFVENLDKFPLGEPNLERFYKFLKWHKDLGGKRITKREMKLIYPKFMI